MFRALCTACHRASIGQATSRSWRLSSTNLSQLTSSTGRCKPSTRYDQAEPVHNVNVQQFPSCPMLPGTGSQAHHPPALPLRICMYSSIPGAETDSDHGCGDTSDDGRGDGDEPPNIMDDDTLSFCYSHGIDPASLPDPDPVADPGLSFWSLLKAGDASRVTVEDLKVMAGANQDRVLRENNSVSIFVRQPLCGRLSTHGEPAHHDLQHRAVRLRILDAMYDELIVDVVDPEFEALTPAEFAAQAVSRFPASTAVALVGLEVEVKLRMFASAVWCGAEASEREAPRGVVHRLGTAALPPPKLSQTKRFCSAFCRPDPNWEMISFGLANPMGSMKKSQEEVDVMLRPLLTSLAVAHLRLGADGTALAYATAASQVIFREAPRAAACVAAQVLNRLGLKTGACAALYMEIVAADPDPAQHDQNTDDTIRHAIRAGVNQIAEGLARTEEEWLEHALGDVTTVQAAAERAVNDHGPEAATQLKLTAARLFAAGSSPHEPPNDRGKVEEAVTKWRAALWLVLDPLAEEGTTGYDAWSIINSRCLLGDAAESYDPKSLRYMDLASLLVMRTRHVHLSKLRRDVFKARCDLGDWEGARDDTLVASLSNL